MILYAREEYHRLYKSDYPRVFSYLSLAAMSIPLAKNIQKLQTSATRTPAQLPKDQRMNPADDKTKFAD